jgi:Protein of unknown function (DUF3102)
MQRDNATTAPAVQAVDGSNYLADLAARIRAEHEASAVAMKRGLEHAINAGRLLIEAKEQLKHGQWLPWLEEHCAMSERSAQLYMRLARHAPELEANPQRVADLSVRGAAELLAPPPATPDDDEDLMEWAQRRLDGPFDDLDFGNWEKGNLSLQWLRTKLMHQAKMPAIASWCFSVTKDDDLPPLCLCPWDELLEAVKALARILNGECLLKFDCKAGWWEMRNAPGIVEIEVERLLGGLLVEMERREKISDEQYEAEWEETYAQVMARLKQQLHQLRDAGLESDAAAS